MENNLMTQTEARQKARELNDRGVAAIAGPVPPGAWGGTERGWTVYVNGEVPTTEVEPPEVSEC